MAVHHILFKIILVCTIATLTFVHFLEHKRILREKEILLRDKLMEENFKLEIATKNLMKRRVLDNNDTYSQSGMHSQYNSISIKPMIVYKLPHLEDINNMKPIVIFPSNRTKVWMVIGLSTVVRSKNIYLTNSIESIVESIDEDDMDKCLIVVLITEMINRKEYVSHVINEFNNYFQSHISSGLIEVVLVPKKYYPQLGQIVPTFNDKQDRAIWRTKQNLDYIFLMMYCLNRGTYYLQLEDDIAASPKFTQKIREHRLFRSNNWFLLEFSKLGFIGKLFNKNSLERMIEFLIMFYDDKPCDWLLHHFLELHTGCSIIYNCKLRRNYSKPSLFQHVGLYSSLNGKIQKIKATDFKGNMKKPIDKYQSHNPPAKVMTSLRTMNKIDLQEIYDYQSNTNSFMFQANNPIIGDEILILFKQPLCIHVFSISSGSITAPKDVFYGAQLEVAPASETPQTKDDDGFVVFDKVTNGTTSSKISLEAILEGSYDSIKKIRVRFMVKSYYWITIRKISVITCANVSLTSTKYS